MKLRNKKTGEIIEDKCLNYILDDTRQFYSLTEFNEEWEDYTPADPLIKDEEDKAIADKAVELIIRDYGEVIKKLEDE